MIDQDTINLIITIVIALAVFTILWKVLKLALRTAIVVALLIVGFYLAFRVMDIQLPEASNYLRSIIDRFK